MKLKIRVTSYLFIAIVFWFCTPLLIWLNIALEIHNMHISAILGFALLNIVYAFLMVDSGILYNLIYGGAVTVLSVLLAFEFGDLGFFENYDAYNILTTILSNILFTILLWEIIYQIKNKMKVE